MHPSLASTVTWQFSADDGSTWGTLSGKSGSTLSLTAVTARDGWKVRAKVGSGSSVKYSHSAGLSVHSTKADPFAVESQFAAMSGWWVVSLGGTKTGTTTGTTVTVAMSFLKVDPTALVSDLRAAYVDASGRATTASIVKTSVEPIAGMGTAVGVDLKVSAPAADVRSLTGDVVKVRDAVTNEYEYYAVS